MKILVTGSNGLLGQKLVALLDRDPSIDFVATARKSLPVNLTRGHFRKLDVTKKDDVTDVITTERPDVVMHTAAMTQVDQCETEHEACWLNNTLAVEFIVRACETTNTHLLHLSTDFIFDGTRGPLDESATPNPISYYGKSKLAAEEIIQRGTMPWTIVRTVLVYGITRDMSRSNIVLWVKKSLEEGKSINVVNDQWRTPTLSEDLAKGCVLAAGRKATGIYHISGEEMMTPFDIAMRTAAFFHLDQSLIHATDSAHFRQPAPRPPKTGFLIDKARRNLGYEPHTFEEGLSIMKSQWE